MSFVSWTYPVLLALTALLYWRLPQKGRIWLILAASYIFYGWWDVRFLALIWTSTTIDFFGSLAIEKKQRPLTQIGFAASVPLFWFGFCQLILGENIQPAAWTAAVGLPVFLTTAHVLLRKFPETAKAKGFFALSIISNLAILGFFKYFNFFADSAEALLASAGFQPDWPTLNILLPVGISFYTFQSLAYTIDVYRKKTRAVESLPTFASYLAFFPQLVAGPIERSHHLMPQIAEKRTFSTQSLHDGARLILTGYFKKVFVADNCAILANYAFSAGTPLNPAWAWIGVLAFAFQIYGDFSGYTNIARGSARLFGIDLMRNFRFPYIAKTPSDFWQRWHISLSSWFRDYVYIPLGGNRHGRARTLLNLMLTMFLAGLWHGAGWMFVLWGVYHGALLVVYRVAPGLNRLDDSELSFGKQVFSSMLMFLLVLFGWGMFRSPDTVVFGHWISACLGNADAGTLDWVRPAGWLALHIAPLLILQFLTRRQQDESEMTRFPWPTRGVIYLLLFMLTVSSGAHDQEFIYFQF